MDRVSAHFGATRLSMVIYSEGELKFVRIRRTTQFYKPDIESFGTECETYQFTEQQLASFFGMPNYSKWLLELQHLRLQASESILASSDMS